MSSFFFLTKTFFANHTLPKMQVGSDFIERKRVIKELGRI